MRKAQWECSLRNRGVWAALGLALVVTGCGGSAAGDRGRGPGSELAMGTMEERTLALIECMEGKGWDPIYDDRDLPSMTFLDVPRDQEDRLTADQAACQEELGLSEPAPDFTDAQLADIYRFEVETAECLRKLGVDIPDPPSEQAFKDRYTTRDPWTAYGFVNQVGEERWYYLNQECPQIPNER